MTTIHASPQVSSSSADAGSSMVTGVSVVIPAFNEERGIASVLEHLKATLASTYPVHEIIVVDDGSEDRTAEVAEAAGARVLRQPQNMGYGASLKKGIAAAGHGVVVITDADGTYDVSAIPELVANVEQYHMVVGARQGAKYHGSWSKSIARRLFRFLVEYAAGRSIPDINSGLRAMRRDVTVRFLEIASDGFSFTTTMTLAFMLNGYYVKYIPVKYFDRQGASKVSHFRDTLRAAQIIVQSILYYNPVKLFLLPVVFLLALAALLGLAAAIAGSAVLVLAATVALSSAVITGGLGMLADIGRRHQLPR
jgi:glycosyltransferase involved in cell wall biosynthesis